MSNDEYQQQQYWEDKWKDIFQRLEDAKVYNNWYITMFILNMNIDETKVSKHPIHYKTSDEFRIATINTSKMDNENRVIHWKRLNNL